jgi:hypothetical protein
MQQMVLAVHSARLNTGPMQTHLDPLATAEITYAALLQSGLEQLQFLNMPDLEPTVAGALAGRLKVVSDSAWGGDVMLATEAMQLQSFADADHTARNSAHLLWALLADLLCAMRTRRPIVYFIPVSPSVLLSEQLSTPQFIAVRALLQALKSEPIEALSFRQVINRDNVAMLNEILASRQYRALVNAHRDIEDGSARFGAVRSSISKATRVVVSKFPSLARDRTAVSVLRFSKRLVDSTMAKWPGALASAALDRATGWIEDRRRLVLYPTFPTVEAIFAHRTNELVRVAGEKALDQWKIDAR